MYNEKNNNNRHDFQVQLEDKLSRGPTIRKSNLSRLTDKSLHIIKLELLTVYIRIIGY